MNEIERCPFCGGEAMLHFRKKIEDQMIFEDEIIISCINCEAEILHYERSYEAIESLVNMWNTRVSGWISVNDGLPEDGKLVLACNIDKPTYFAFYSKGDFLDIMDAEILTKYVTHWQPLPEPMKRLEG